MQKKQSILIALALLVNTITYTQVGIGTVTPHASAILDVESTTKGFLPPRMSDAQRDAIGNPAEGLTIFNTSENCLQWYNGTLWFSACSGATTPPSPVGPIPSVLPENIILEAIAPYSIASVFDTDYLPYALPSGPAKLPGKSIDDNADGTNEAVTIDVLGTLTTSGVIIKIPYTVSGSALPPLVVLTNSTTASETASVDIPAYSQTITIPAAFTNNNTATAITFEYAAQSLAVGSGTIDATLKATTATLEAVKLDLNSGLGTDFLGWLLGTFTYALDNAGGTAGFQVRVTPGIPDLNFGDGVHDFLYLPVASTTNKVWLNNNLGANYANINKNTFNPAQQATARNDFNAYGSHFQWGRVADGHEIVNWTSATAGAVTTATTALSSIPEPINTNFITGSNWYNGTSPAPNDLWKDNTKTIYDPCPRGFRVPSETELNAERTSWTPLSTAGAHASPLKLTTAGLRDGASGGGLAGAGTTLFYWASTIAISNSRSVLNTNMHTSVRVAGGSIRCIQN